MPSNSTDRGRSGRTRAALVLMLLVALALAAAFAAYSRSRVAPSPTPTPEPLIPTLPAQLRPTVTPTIPATRAALAPSTPAPSATPLPARPFVLNGPPRSRVCVSLPGASATVYDFDWQDAAPGWWLNWNTLAQPPAGPPFAQMVRLQGASFHPSLSVITRIAAGNPGSLWLVGNEPDVPWQDNATPKEYATAYAQVYAAIKAADPAALVAIGGVSQPTPLRLQYVDRILAAYRQQTGQDMPVDIWNIHAFVLREERDSWGVGIPPGMTESQGTLRELADHADLALFRGQIVAFRQWMAERGLRDRPLIVTEYGVLMPEQYGFPPEVVSEFLTGSFDFFLEARDSEIGYPQDDNRLVQAFCWYSAADRTYPTSNLFDPETREITPAGEAYRDYVRELAGD